MRWFRLAACKACVKARVPAESFGSEGSGRARRDPGLLDFRFFLAGPRAGGVRERLARLVVDDRSRRLEDRALERGSSRHLAEARLAVLRLGRLLVVDQAPCLIEELLADESGHEPACDADRDEKQLHGEGNVYPGDPTGIPGSRWQSRTT